MRKLASYLTADVLSVSTYGRAAVGDGRNDGVIRLFPGPAIALTFFAPAVPGNSSAASRPAELEMVYSLRVAITPNRLSRLHVSALIRLAAAACFILSFPTAVSGETPDPGAAPEFQVFLIGNSHSSRMKLPELLASVIRAGVPDSEPHAEAAPRWAFLDDHLDDRRTARALDSRDWTHVVLQAQKYSTTGQYRYSTDAAEAWIHRVRERGAAPILFPEWGRRGQPDEGARVHGLHQEIAGREAACIAPVGLAWDIVRQREGSLRLHAHDGNHASRAGALLTAFVLYRAVTGRPAAALPMIERTRVKDEVQHRLKQAADAAWDLFPEDSRRCPRPPVGGAVPVPDEKAEQDHELSRAGGSVRGNEKTKR